MFYTKEFFAPDDGQPYRDGVRGGALEETGYLVRSLDVDHCECSYGIRDNRHCTANYLKARNMIKAMRELWGEEVCFDDIFLDWYNSPVSYSASLMF